MARGFPNYSDGRTRPGNAAHGLPIGGTVYRARDLQDGSLVACKILHLTNPSRGELERFAREARLLASLSHSGIVRYITHGQTPEGLPFLVMEWLEGESLDELLKRRCLGLDEALLLIRLVAGALSAAHQRGIIHRELVRPPFLVEKLGRCADFGKGPKKESELFCGSGV